MLHSFIRMKNVEKFVIPKFADLSNDEVDDEDEPPPNKTQRSRYLAGQQQHNMVRKQRSLTPENQTNSPKPRALTPERRGHMAFDAGDRLQAKHNDKVLISSRSSSSSSYSGAENETTIGYRRAPQRGAGNGKTANENRIRRSR